MFEKGFKKQMASYLSRAENHSKKCSNREIQHNRRIFSWRPAASKGSPGLRWKEQFIATSLEAKKDPATWAVPEEQGKAAQPSPSITALIPVQSSEPVQFYGSYL